LAPQAGASKRLHDLTVAELRFEIPESPHKNFGPYGVTVSVIWAASEMPVVVPVAVIERV
jgi:hypothetical protein